MIFDALHLISLCYCLLPVVNNTGRATINNINIASITIDTNTNTNININTTTTMSSSPSGALAVPEAAKSHGHNDIASSQASYASADAEKTDVEQGDITDLEKERRLEGENGEKSDRDVDIEATAETKETAPAADEAEDDDDDYPKGAKLASIVLALCLTIFLMSLDFVRAYS